MTVRLKGQVTVFISLTMMCVFALLCCLLESARTAGARWYLQMAAASAMDSVFSQYHRPLWDRYRLLFAEYEDEEELTADYLSFLEPYLATENWYPLTAEGAVTEEFLTAVDDQGSYLEQEVLDYMKYGIWKLDFDTDTVTSLYDDIKEAGAVKTTAGQYRGHAREALQLEKALEDISNSLKKQAEWKQKCLNRLRHHDCSGFCSDAKKLIQELKRMPGLVETYSKRADAMARGMAASRRSYEEQKEELRESTRELMEQEFRQYESYIALDGEHRQEIERQTALSAEQMILTESVIEEAIRVQQIIDDWEEEDDEEDDGPDLEALWNPVIRRFERLRITELSFPHGVADKEKEGWLKQIERMSTNGLLNLVLPEGTVLSEAELQLAGSPSQAAIWSNGTRHTPLFDQLLINEYCGQFFACFRSEEPKIKPDDFAAFYEMEYLIAGRGTDKENLGNTLARLLAVREGLNLVHILSDSAKREQARTLALAISGAAAVTPIVFVVTFFIMSVWALGEAIMDLRGLLAGKKVVLLKTSDTWTLSIDQLLTMGQQKGAETGGGDKGLDYLSWLKILLLVEDTVRQEYRMMDMIQMNLQQKQADFRMYRCLYHTRIRTMVCGKHVFFSLAFVENQTGRQDHQYPMSVLAERIY